MIVELHAIQSFAPANLNRDDTGAPKECTFGGVRRARVSSQSWKRAMRSYFRHHLGDLAQGTRTKRAHAEVLARLRSTAPGLPEAVAERRAAVVLEAAPLELSLKRRDQEDEVKTGQLLFFRDADLDMLAAVAAEFGDELDNLPCSLDDGEGKRKDKGKQAKATLPKVAGDRVKRALVSPGDALDVALFGRMIAELPEGNVDAACQVAHAIGTHRLAAEFDYYTAVDDLKPEDSEGADMIGTIQFNASCLYRYAVLDVEQLAENLGEAADHEHLASARRAFAHAFIDAIPTGKQNSFAARNPPAAVLAVSRKRGAWNLANAFVAPVHGRESEDGIVGESVRRLIGEFTSLNRMYGRPDDRVDAVLLAAHRDAARDGVRTSTISTS